MDSSKIIEKYNEVQFLKLGWSFEIDQTAFTIGGISIQWYGLIIALGLTLAALYCFPRMKRFGIDPDSSLDAVIGGILAGIVGARLYYVIPNFELFKGESFKETLISIFNIRNGGLAIYGGIIGALVVGIIVCKIKKVKILPMLDITSLGLLIGQGIGRWGNFINQEAFGTNTDSIFGMTGGRIQNVINAEMQKGGSLYENGIEMVWSDPVHPCFLYESFWCLLGFVILAFYSKRRKYDGQIFLLYLAWYGFGRAFIEGLRIDSLMLGSIRISQALSIVLFIAAVILLIVIGFKVKRDPESFVLYAATEESRMLIEQARRKSMKGFEDSDDDEDDEIGILDDEDNDEEISVDSSASKNTGKENSEIVTDDIIKED